MNISTLIDQPNEFDFYQAVYTLERQLGKGKDQHRKVGHDSLPQNELIRFKADQHLGFPGTSISKVEIKKEQKNTETAVDMHVSFMGLTGTSGVLPQHYTELVLERMKLKDFGMREFFDLFNHRLISLYYRAWEKYRFPIGFEKSTQQSSEPFTYVLNQLSGNKGVIGNYYAGIYNQKNRTAAGLKQILSDFCQCDIEIEQFQGKWHIIKPSEQTQLGARNNPEGQYACLGVDASIGSRVWDVNSSINVCIKVGKDRSINDYFLNGTIYKHVKQILKSYLGDTINSKIQLKVKLGQAPIAQLSRQAIPLGMGCVMAFRPIKSEKEYTILL